MGLDPVYNTFYTPRVFLIFGSRALLWVSPYPGIVGITVAGHGSFGRLSLIVRPLDSTI